VNDHATYGGRLGWNITSKVEIEAQVSRTETAFVMPGSHELFGTDGKRLGDLRIDYLLGYGTFNFGHGRAVPYVTLGMGAARLEADICRGAPTPCVNPGRDTRFTASAGVGLKTFLAPHVGLRFDGRYYGTFLRDSNRDRCDRCDNRTDWLSNGDVTGGLIFAF
jgi:opacity protein-like surface antigen